MKKIWKKRILKLNIYEKYEKCWKNFIYWFENITACRRRWNKGLHSQGFSKYLRCKVINSEAVHRNKYESDSWCSASSRQGNPLSVCLFLQEYPHIHCKISSLKAHITAVIRTLPPVFIKEASVTYNCFTSLTSHCQSFSLRNIHKPDDFSTRCRGCQQSLGPHDIRSFLVEH